MSTFMNGNVSKEYNPKISEINYPKRLNAKHHQQQQSATTTTIRTRIQQQQSTEVLKMASDNKSPCQKVFLLFLKS